METREVLGVEAGRLAIIQEISGVMESHGITVDKRHIYLLSDTMTFTGKILGNTRHGLNKQKDSKISLIGRHHHVGKFRVPPGHSI